MSRSSDSTIDFNALSGQLKKGEVLIARWRWGKDGEYRVKVIRSQEQLDETLVGVETSNFYGLAFFASTAPPMLTRALT